MTDFPPPEGFDGIEEGEWEDLNYSRACTPREAAILAAHQAELIASERNDEATLRDAWFALLAEVEEGGGSSSQLSTELGADCDPEAEPGAGRRRRPRS